jgi:hypothetical protein
MMSNWVENQTQEAFSMWRRYLAMGLHFRATGYDYSLYNGKTNATLESFKKDPGKVKIFMKLKNRLSACDIKQDEFLFAHELNGSLKIERLLNSDALDVWQKWMSKYGNPTLFNNSVKDQMVAIMTPDIQTVPRFIDRCLMLREVPYEVVASCLERGSPETYKNVSAMISDNALLQMHLDRAIKIQKIYKYLNIL